MEYIVSFLTFFLIYFSFTYIFRRVNIKPEANRSRNTKQKGKTGINNSNKHKNQSSNHKDKGEFYRILKNSLMVSLIYIIIIIIFRFFK